MKELAIGEEIRIKCVEDNHRTYGQCEGCIFGIEDDCSLPGNVPCSAIRRKDGKSVHFELVEE